LHCDLSISNILLKRKDDESEPIGLLIDYDFSVNAAGSEAMNHGNTAADAADAGTADATPIGKRGAAASFEGREVVGARRLRRQKRRTVRFSQLLETLTNRDLQAGYTALYGYRGSP
jgi:hypothetical protein